jgi:hypothetical protein
MIGDSTEAAQASPMAQMVVAAITAAAMGGAHRATAIGFVSAFSRLPVHPANTKANNRAMILIRTIPFCQVFEWLRHLSRETPRHPMTAIFY